MSQRQETVEMPKPTAWPMVLAFALMLAGAGLLTNLVFSGVGLLLTAIAIAGWVGEILPGRGTEEIPLVSRAEEVRAPSPTPRRRVSPAGASGPRAQLPYVMRPISAGVWGGIAGGIAMAVIALLYGVISGRGIWYPVNLLGAMVAPGAAGTTLAQLEQFHAATFLAGLAIHAVASLIVGLLFGLLLPTLPGGPVIWGGVVGPLLWTGLIYAFMEVLDPVMNRLVDWPWFIASQFAFGLAAGIVVFYSETVRAPQPQGDVGENRGSDRQESGR